MPSVPPEWFDLHKKQERDRIMLNTMHSMPDDVFADWIETMGEEKYPEDIPITRYIEQRKQLARDSGAWFARALLGATTEQDKLDSLRFRGWAKTVRNEAAANSAEALEAEADRILERAARLRARAERIANAAELEPQSEGAVVMFTHTFGSQRTFVEPNPRSLTYTYVAVRVANGTWYVTGRETKAYTWAELVTKYHALSDGEFWVVSEWVHGTKHGDR